MTGVVVVGESEPADVAVFHQLSAALAQHASDSEIVVIANAVPVDCARALETIAQTVPDTTVHFLAQQTDVDTAMLVGIEQALGDWVVLLTPTPEEVAALDVLLEETTRYQVVFGGSHEPRQGSAFYRLAARGYFWLYRLVSGTPMDWPAPRIRIYSRAAARFIVSQLDGEFMLRALNFSGAFPAVRSDVELGQTSQRLRKPMSALRKALRGLLNASGVPLRMTIIIALAAGVIALCSSLYTLAVYVFQPHIQPGWTTLSLEISLMMLLFSMMFALLAEYVLGVYRATAPRRRVAIVREIRSPIRRQHSRLNVIGADGGFHLGAPAQTTARQ